MKINVGDRVRSQVCKESRSGSVALWQEEESTVESIISSHPLCDATLCKLKFPDGEIKNRLVFPFEKAEDNK